MIYLLEIVITEGSVLAKIIKSGNIKNKSEKKVKIKVKKIDDYVIINFINFTKRIVSKIHNKKYCLTNG